MSNFAIKTTATPSAEDLSTFLELISTDYQSNPLTTAFITEIDGVAPGTEYSKLTPERLKQHFTLGLTAAFHSNILLTTVSSPASSSPLAAALFEPPDFSGIPPSHARKQPGPILSEYRGIARSLKARHLVMPESGPHQWETPASPSQASSGPSGDPFPAQFNKDADTELRTFFHLALLVRNTKEPQDLTAKAAEEAMQVYLDKAKAADVPIFLEVSQLEYKKKMESWGFKIVEEVQVGEGRVDRRGWPTSGGEGVSVWAMIFNP